MIHVWEAPSFVPLGSALDAGEWSVSLVELVKKNAETALARFVSDAAERGHTVRESRAEPGSPAQLAQKLRSCSAACTKSAAA